VPTLWGDIESETGGEDEEPPTPGVDFVIHDEDGNIVEEGDLLDYLATHSADQGETKGEGEA
jgi:hypothetical protein